MGSFNETCALSGLNISPGTPVKILFLTQNPYISSDEKEAHRGVYHYDQWFARTPPIDGVYDDYGEATYDKDKITELIAKCFDEDIVERPFGFNKYHAGPVLKGRGIEHYLSAAWQGRLLVLDKGFFRKNKQIPEEFPTWENIHEIIRKKKLPLQIDTEKGYNAHPVRDGVVCVTWSEYSDQRKKITVIEKLLSKDYDTKIISKFQDRDDYDLCLLVTVKNGFKNPTLITESIINKEEMTAVLNRHPEINNREEKKLPVLAVMVRQDVWDVYCKLNMKDVGYSDSPTTVEKTFKELKDLYEKKKKISGKDDIDSLIAGMNLKSSCRERLFNIPCQTMLTEHIEAALSENKFPIDNLLQRCAELFQVEIVMANLHQDWHIPPLGGQDGEWKLRTKLIKEMLKICQKEVKQENEWN